MCKQCTFLVYFFSLGVLNPILIPLEVNYLYWVRFQITRRVGFVLNLKGTEVVLRS